MGSDEPIKVQTLGASVRMGRASTWWPCTRTPHGEAPRRETGGPSWCKQIWLTCIFFPFHALQQIMFMKTHPSNYQKKKNHFWGVLELLQSNVNFGQSWSPPALPGARQPVSQGFRCKFPGFSRVGPRDISQSRAKELCTVQWYIPGYLYYLSFTNSKQNNKKDFKS